MAVLGTLTTEFKLKAGEGAINLTSDTIKVILVKSGFVFDRNKHQFLKNLKGSISGASNIDFTASTKTIHKGDGGFLNAGFVSGNHITVTNTSSNNNSFTIYSVTDTDIVVNEDIVVDETGTSASITADDELPTANGYTQENMTTGTITASVDTSNSYASFTFPTVTWTASGGDIGATPGAILYDDTEDDKTIIGYIDFGADQTATDGTTFNIANGEIRIV